MPIAKKIDVNPEFMEQMRKNLSKTSDSSVEEKDSPVTVKTEKAPEVKISAPAAKPVEEKKEKYADVMNVRLSKGRRNEIKAFCTSNGITVTQYIESSFEFFAKEVAAGNIVISKGGITKVSQ